ncbi:hypothetical protein Bhyg_12865 [Pseudolycoriella hygida]|uniref:Uncharacterized protein n=1 Tax=Pseudolycoriella hygida TaxID=35572 RepID=A0A9Q0MY18_9DIPT|nr:hypothetical protein Bhyg_12865 [Pseudolycoriella hygida]
MKKNWIFIVIICWICGCLPRIGCSESDSTDLSCRGHMTFENVTLTAYYPSIENNDPKEYLDTKGHALATLQDFLAGKIDFVTVSMDEGLKIPYGTPICIPQLNAHYRRQINLQVRDSANNVKGRRYRRVDICVQSESDSYDPVVNLKRVSIVL